MWVWWSGEFQERETCPTSSLQPPLEILCFFFNYYLLTSLSDPKGLSFSLYFISSCPYFFFSLVPCLMVWIKIYECKIQVAGHVFLLFYVCMFSWCCESSSKYTVFYCSYSLVSLPIFCHCLFLVYCTLWFSMGFTLNLCLSFWNYWNRVLEDFL